MPWSREPHRAPSRSPPGGSRGCRSGWSGGSPSTARDSVAGWDLDGLDLEPVASAARPGQSGDLHAGRPQPDRPGRRRRRCTRRSVAGLMPSCNGTPRAAPPSRRRTRNALARLGDLIAPLDLVSASLDGIREQLLGIPYVGVLDGAPAPTRCRQATGTPTPLFGGTLRLDELRLVDAFGRVLDVPAAALARQRDHARSCRSTGAGGIRLRPRIQNLARWLFRLVDPGQPAGTDPSQLREAYVDQLDPAARGQPGGRLPAARPHRRGAGGVHRRRRPDRAARPRPASPAPSTWEPAPGRPLPPDAGPLADLAAQARIAGEFAAGLVQADAAARGPRPATDDSALSALLRAIDTTLWTVDTFAGDRHSDGRRAGRPAGRGRPRHAAARRARRPRRGRRRRRRAGRTRGARRTRRSRAAVPGPARRAGPQRRRAARASSSTTTTPTCTWSTRWSPSQAHRQRPAARPPRLARAPSRHPPSTRRRTLT